MTATPGAAVMFYIHFALATHFFSHFFKPILKISIIFAESAERQVGFSLQNGEPHCFFALYFLNQKFLKNERKY